MIKLKLTAAEETVRAKTIQAIKQKIDRKTAEIVSETDKRTIIYALWSLAGIFLIFINFPKPVFHVVSFIMILVVGYFLVGFIRSLKKIFSFINSFDQEIKKIVKKEVQDNVGDSLKNKIGLRLSGLNHADIENLCISYFVRELAKRFKKYKQLILIRLVAYTIAVLFFKEVLFNILV